MKICWDNLEKYQVKYYAKSGTFRVFKGSQWKSLIYHESCLKCGEPFLNPKNQDRFCCSSCANSYTNIKNGVTWNVEKSKETKLKKYGDENFNGSKKASQTRKNFSDERRQEIELKKQETWIENYGVDNPNKSREVREKVEATNLETYGSKCSWGNKDVQKKCVETTKKNCGIEDDSITNVGQIPQVKEKIAETNIERHGVSCVFVLEEFRYSGTVSPISQTFFWKLYNKLPPKLKEQCYFHELNKEFSTSYCSFDFKLRNCVIEFNGDLWHANPNKYSSDDLVISFTSKKLFAKDIWEREEKRNNKIKDDGYSAHVVWENDVRKDIDKQILLCLKFILETYK